MSSIGPQLPPHLAKRKRSPEDDENAADSQPAKTLRANGDEIALDDGDSDSDDGYGPTAPKAPTAAAPAKPSIGPTLPPTTAASNAQEIALDPDSDEDTGPAPPPATVAAATPAAPRRVMGPAPPPADLAERPPSSPVRHAEPASDLDDDSDSDDDYGPALPGATTRPNTGPAHPAFNASAPSEPARPKRDDWMLAPPTSSGYQERDPTKIKSRKFASGASATSRPKDGSAGGLSSIWTETPEEKAKRLADAVLGRGNGGAGETPVAAAGSKRGGGGGSREQQDKIRAFTEQTRGRSLYDEHQSSRKSAKDAGKGAGKDDGKGGDDEDDDPSKRAFDREKDMGLGMKITASQRKELLNRASDFGGRFQKGNYL
ncbi:GPALPP motifs-containing protein 1 [Cytospora mali]|uniref:GPALPP motifs-containing protein 1 n=1 Tax=Cytospora mali TaxID=578113 RepID=A0A194V4D0_CYTMA|nr:GPALPP motifs-containing protein 1 [Valsa mali var. pyri (nom. inval.)]